MGVVNGKFDIDQDNFNMACKTADIPTVKKALETNMSIDPSWNNNQMLKYCIYETHFDVAKLMLASDRLSKLDESVLGYGLSSLNIEIINLLLHHPMITIPDNILNWCKEEGLPKEIHDLVQEHMFRLDGPVYTQNIIQ
uniref:Uncharacterized protein n=1 Tax=viral metagenome TaxID=1070528 RepID=A0A6C0JWZ8_9ZZZZ